jgi:hypothetical protein
MRRLAGLKTILKWISCAICGGNRQPQPVPPHTVRLPRVLSITDNLHTSLQFTSLWRHCHGIETDVNEWPESVPYAETRETISSLVLFGPLQLNMVLLTIKSISTTPTSIIRLSEVPNFTVNIFIAVGKRFTDMLNLDVTSGSFPLWIPTNLAGLKQTSDHIERGEEV